MGPDLMEREVLAASGPRGEELQSKPLRKQRPAELSTFIASLGVAAGAIGLDVGTEVVVAAFILVGTFPAIITWAVNLYRDALRDLGE